ncbi:MAG TPA: hypothetical protein VE955_00350 [Candidatus Dormibacteraeota bacterium]|jgi:hypothetical protein|nr:hypothetical protein [Candidatus Dormibacteraeota bacterium]
MPDRLVNLIYSKVGWIRSDNSDTVTINVDPSTVRKTTMGVGFLQFHSEGWSNDLSFLQQTPANVSLGQAQISLVFNRLLRFPCTGIVTSSTAGYLIAPTAKVEADEGKGIVAMMFSHRTTPFSITTDKSVLSIPNRAHVKVLADEGQLQIRGTVSRSKFDRVRVLLSRSPNLSVRIGGYGEELVVIKEPGEISTTWKPVSRVFQDFLLVFYSSTIGGEDFEGVANMLGAPQDDYRVPNTVIGDGPFTDYKLRLIIDHNELRVSDETSLAIV